MTNWTSKVFKEIKIQHLFTIFYFLSKSTAWEVWVSWNKLNEYESDSEQETSNEEESDEESNYSDFKLSLSDTDEFERMSALGYLKEKDITMLLKIRKKREQWKSKEKDDQMSEHQRMH